MKQTGKLLTAGISALGFLLLILDSKTAFQGAVHGIELCIRTVIPSLFPFFILSILLTGSLSGTHTPCLRPLGKLLRIPNGSEGIFLIGLLGGYPSGAQSVAQACRSGQLSKFAARRMLGFCSNAGPAFIFGMIGPLFAAPAVPWVLWGIHILSALITGVILPGRSSETLQSGSVKSIGIQEALTQGVRIMANVCGWIVLFRVILSFLDRWVLWLLPESVQVIIAGILELSNGCTELGKIPDEGIRFIICSGFLSLGGVCILLQTVSVTESCGLGLYISGKLIQTVVSLAISSLAANILFRNSVGFPVLIVIVLIIPLTFLIFHGINSRNPERIRV